MSEPSTAHSLNASSCAHDVGNFVASLGPPYQKYKVLFVDNVVDGYLIDDLTLTDLEEIGIPLHIHRKVIHRQLRKGIGLSDGPRGERPSEDIPDTYSEIWLHRGTNQWKMIVYKGTTHNELDMHIQRLLSLPPGQTFVLQNEDGDSVVISGAIKSGTHLYVWVPEKPVPAKDQNWTWDPAKKRGDIFFTNGNKTVSQKRLYQHGMTITRGTEKFEAGQHTWSVCIHLQIYTTSFVIDANAGSSSDHYEEYPNFWEMHQHFTTGRGQSARNDGRVELIQHLNMEKHLLIIINKNNPSEIIHVTGIPCSVYPIVAFKSGEATITGYGPELIDGINLQRAPSATLTYLRE